MKISILGCGWLGLPLGKFLVEKGYAVKGSTTSEEKIALLESVGIEPFLIKFSPHLEMVVQPLSDYASQCSPQTTIDLVVCGDTDNGRPHGKGLPWYVNQFLDSETLIICIPPRAGKYGEDFHIQQIQSLIENLGDSPIKSIIYTSSTSVYPELNKEMTEEDEVIENHALIQVENLLKSLPKNITILRCGGLMGGERIPAKYFAGKTINTGKIPVNYVHQEDIIQIITMILEKEFWNETFNVVSPEHPVREDVYLKNCEDLGFEKPIFEEPTQQIPYKIISPQKLILQTGYAFLFSNPLDFIYSKENDSIKHLLLNGNEENIITLINEIVEKKQAKYYKFLVEAFLKHEPSLVKNKLALALSKFQLDNFIPIIIGEVNKYLNGEDIGTLIYSLNGKDFGSYIYDIVKILCQLNDELDNYEALEMIVLIIDDYKGFVPQKELNKSIKLVKSTLLKMDKEQQKYRYLEWVLNWLLE